MQQSVRKLPKFYCLCLNYHLPSISKINYHPHHHFDGKINKIANFADVGGYQNIGTTVVMLPAQVLVLVGYYTLRTVRPLVVDVGTRNIFILNSSIL